jgi:hypothetical protein
MDDRLHGANLGVPGQGGEAGPDYRLAENAAVLLGHIPAGAKPATGCHDDGCDASCHNPAKCPMKPNDP